MEAPKQVNPKDRENSRLLESYYSYFEKVKEDTNYFNENLLNKSQAQEIIDKIPEVRNLIRTMEFHSHQDEYIVDQLRILVPVAEVKSKKILNRVDE